MSLVEFMLTVYLSIVLVAGVVTVIAISRHWGRVDDQLKRGDTEVCGRCVGRGSHEELRVRDRVPSYHVVRCECCLGHGVVKKPYEATGGLR